MDTPSLPVGSNSEKLQTALHERVDNERLPRSCARLIAAGVSGTLTILFGTVLGLTLLRVIAGKQAPWLAIVAFSSFTFLGGWLTWRWARSLPPSKRLASPRELDELD